MSVILYGLKNCDSCKKALKAFQNAGREVAFRDIRLDAISKVQLQKWLAMLGRDKLLNTRSTTWRGLGEEERKVERDEDVIDLLEKYPTLVKRPVIEYDGQVYVGWSKVEQGIFIKATGKISPRSK